MSWNRKKDAATEAESRARSDENARDKPVSEGGETKTAELGSADDDTQGRAKPVPEGDDDAKDLGSPFDKSPSMQEMKNLPAALRQATSSGSADDARLRYLSPQAKNGILETLSFVCRREGIAGEALEHVTAEMNDVLGMTDHPSSGSNMAASYAYAARLLREETPPERALRVHRELQGTAQDPFASPDQASIDKNAAAKDNSTGNDAVQP